MALCLKFGFVAFVTLMMMLQSLVAAGFMPGVGADGEHALVVCSGMGEKVVYVDLGMDDPQPHHTSSPCGFAMMTHGFFDVPSPVYTPIIAVYNITQETQLFYILHSTNRVLWHSRGPPVFLS
ncbi:MAG: hypothetical protein WC043_02125 [Pseudobdellovibrionaceae bacterium]